MSHSDLDELRAIADDGCPRSREFRRELHLAILAAVRRMPPAARRKYLRSH